MGTGEDRWHLGHRPALDGLRGVAILLVVAAHAHIPFLGNGGPVGVGMFFALSGFLITGLLLEERDRTGQIGFRAFYVRRLRRLAPALLALLAVVAVARAILGPWVIDWSVLPAVLLYVGNWLPINGVDLGALGHTWSLSVEEQFYVVWPLVVAALATRRRVVVAAATLAVASYLVRWWLLLDGEVGLRVPLGSDTVAVALLLGAVTVGLRMRGGPGRSSRVLLVIAGAGLAGMLFVGTLWYLILGLPMVAAFTCLALWSATGDGGAAVLEASWLRWLGERSYGLYLWHAPILWAMSAHYELPWPVLVLVGVPVSLLLAEASYRWIETPFRSRRPVEAPTREPALT